MVYYLLAAYILTLTGKSYFFFFFFPSLSLPVGPVSVFSVILLLCTRPYVLFFFPLDASLLSFPLFYMLFLSDLGGGRYCTDKRPHPLPFPHLH